jgi:metallo-beta-lactamase family protein
MAELLFHGACGEVTGSMHMLRFDDKWVALDCGLFQGRRADAEEKNRRWPMPPREISAVVVSHAHTDHTGRLPLLVRDGFEGPIYCTPATRDLCAIMLPDSAHIQQEDVFYLNKRRAKKGLPPIEPLYDYKDALAAVTQIRTVAYGHWFEIIPGLIGQYLEAGHMLGSAGVRLECAKRNGRTISIYFTGDVGRMNHPIIRDPAEFPPVDVMIGESTYGARVNESTEDAEQRLVDVVRRTVERGGKVIIPAFSVGRTQTIMYYLHRQMEAGAVPRVPVFVDSPLAVNATEVFKMHPECYDAEAREFQSKTGDILGSGCCTYIRDVEESKELHRRRRPCVIISASGMCEAGRIRHHIKNNIESPRNTILFAGYQAEGTLGRKVVDGARTIDLFHETYPVRAEVAQLHGFSGHADQADLLRMFGALAPDGQQVYLVHGELAQSTVLAQRLRERGWSRATIAERGQRCEL